ncbi:MAG: hypothetical protein KME04_13645 [Pleurocapsa minor GSE-CHR-MK-17-07R]|jgi:hypothetical protein|nr:hypothetical protein [Pleurocapsa minor GSE-CHR-MK 17-07R]
MKLRTLSLTMMAGLCIWVLAACNLGDLGGAVPTTGDTSGDASAAQRFLPNIAGFTVTEASNITDALATVGTGAAALTLDPLLAGVIAGVDGLIECYNSVGAAAARVYVQADAATAILNGALPNFGAMAVINGDRIVNNFLPCAAQQVQGFSAQSADAVQICSNNGTFTVDGENLFYLYAATNPALCAAFQSAIPVAPR